MCMYVLCMHLCVHECSVVRGQVLAFHFAWDKVSLCCWSAELSTVDLQTSGDALVSTAEVTDFCAMWITFIWVLTLKVFLCFRGKHFTYWSIHSPSPFIHIFNAHKIRVCRDVLGCQLLSSGFFFMCSLVLTCYPILWEVISDFSRGEWGSCAI